MPHSSTSNSLGFYDLAGFLFILTIVFLFIFMEKIIMLLTTVGILCLIAWLITNYHTELARAFTSATGTRWHGIMALPVFIWKLFANACHAIFHRSAPTPIHVPAQQKIQQTHPRTLVAQPVRQLQESPYGRIVRRR